MTVNPRPPGLLPQDEEPGTCFLCGHRGEFPEIIRTVWKMDPRRVIRRCKDDVACLRRRRGARS